MVQMALGHVGLNVTDVDASVAFYTAVFDATVIAKAGGDRPFALLGTGGVTLSLWQQASAAASPTVAGMHHLAFQVDSVEDVHAAKTALEALGTTFVYDGVVAHREGATSGGIYFDDPDGIRIEVFTAAGVDPTTAPTPGGLTCGLF